MAKEIPDELKQFKSALDGKTGGMNSSATTIASKLGDVAAASTSAKGEVEAAYKPADGNNVAASKLGSLSMLITSISDDLTSTISSACSSADSIISMVVQMENLITDINTQQGIISSERAKEKPDTGRISSANAKIAEDEAKFDTLESDAKSALESLKAMDKTADTSSVSVGAADSSTPAITLDDYTKYLDQLKYGSFTKQTFVASNNVSIDYFLYVPDYGTNVSGLPVFMYMHGAGDRNVGDHIVTDNCFGAAIKNKEVTPSGIVVLPYVSNGVKYYENKEFRKALAELPVAVSKQYNGDPNRISVGGTSYGAVVSYLLVNENPGTFSAVVNACGANNVTDAFNGVKVWNFNGDSNVGNHTTKNYVAKQNDATKAAGGITMPYIIISGQYGHSNVGDRVFRQKQDDGTGNKVWVFEWAFAQVKGENLRKVPDTVAARA